MNIYSRDKMTFQSPNSQKPFDQFRYLHQDLSTIVNRKSHRWLSMWFSGSPYTLLSYRLDRFGYLVVKGSWRIFRLFFSPFFILFHLLGAHHEIHYTADIGGHFHINHTALGIVVAGHSVIGNGLVLTGGNCIGVSAPIKVGDLVLGNNVEIGANAVILGPVKIGNRVTIGAGAVVINDAPDGSVLVGVPARNVKPVEPDWENA